MEKCAPSIFNDVIGPVMRGPSSYYVAVAARIGKLLRMSTHNKVKHVVVDFDTNGSLAESYHVHGFAYLIYITIYNCIPTIKLSKLVFSSYVNV